MKKCRFCGAELPDQAKFCLECMTPLEEKTLITTKTKRPILPLLISCAALLGVVIFSVCAVANGCGSRGELPISDTGAQTSVITETDAKATDGAITETAADITITDKVTYKITSAETKTQKETRPATEADVTEAQTADTHILGTVGYGPPEQYGIYQTDKRSDIYSVGVLLNVMLTGKHPAELLASGKAGRIITKCTSISPELRYSDVKNLITSL